MYQTANQIFRINIYIFFQRILIPIPVFIDVKKNLNS
jgi:hypothetical protein